MIEGWRIYKHALLPTNPPHKLPNLEVLGDGNIWREKVLIVRYTTDFDVKGKTEWWYCIKDEPFEITEVNAKKRYEINRGLKNVNIMRIKTKDYARELIDITEKAYANYPSRYRPNINKEQLMKKYCIDTIEKDIDYWGIFNKHTSKIIGYAMCILNEEYVNLAMVKVDPDQLKSGANAALIYTLLLEYLNTGKFRYICDGERNLLHETNYQDYLVKYFGFRRAYCNLHVLYRPSIKIAVKMLFPFRKFIKRLNNFSVISKVNYLLDIESIIRGKTSGE